MDLEEEKLSLKYTHMIALRLFFKKLITIKIKRIGNNLVDRMEMKNKQKLRYGEEYSKEITEIYENKIKENTRLKNKERYLLNKEIKKVYNLGKKYFNEWCELYHYPRHPQKKIF